MIEFIHEMSHGLTNSYIAEISGLSDRTIRKVITNHNTSLQYDTYYRIIEALGKHHKYSRLYIAERMRQCEEARIICRLDFQ